uniref:Uncharacterized protein n=1 Tax=Brassica oleracea TaxID=3712 RepID=A0A3P6DRP3_BRAOL|nr:unnamed protein product [Brassica oleracea]
MSWTQFCMDNRDSVNNEGDVDNSMGIGAISHYVELPRVAKEILVVTEWEAGLAFEMFQELPSKVVVKDLIDRGSQQNIFVISIVNSDKSRYVVKRRGANEGCKWFVRATRIRNSEAFSIRTYIKMHSCSRATSSTGIKKKATPRCVAAIVHSDYSGLFDTTTPKTLVGLVQRRLGVEVSYATVWRGKKQAVKDMRGSPQEGYKKVPSYLYMLEKVNPDSRTSLLLDGEKRFKYLFVALGASIEGFQYMRKVITVDATILKIVQGGGRDEVTLQFRKLHKFIQSLSLNSSIKSIGRGIHCVLCILIKVSMSRIGRNVISPVQDIGRMQQPDRQLENWLL